MRHLVTELSGHRDAWPFQQPVNGDEVTDYYEVIKEPMGKKSSLWFLITRLPPLTNGISSLDISALEANVENDVYSTMDMFIKDAQKIFDNCRTYNAETTSYAKCANRLERYFKERLKVWCNID
jgi:histone acetyltransferase